MTSDLARRRLVVVSKSVWLSGYRWNWRCVWCLLMSSERFDIKLFAFWVSIGCNWARRVGLKKNCFLCREYWLCYCCFESVLVGVGVVL